jgi:aspartate-semialdehyde dehydrogenase
MIKIGILGATGMGGREAVKHQKKLEEQGENYAELELVTGSPSSEGRKLGEVFREKEEALSEKYSFWEPQECPEKYRDIEVEGLDADEISERVECVISALPSSIAEEIEPELRERGVNVFSNASQFRWKEEIPLMIPEVNSQDIRMLEEQGEGVQANNPNCTTAGYVPVVAALRDLGVEKIDLVTFQAISGKGDKIASEGYADSIHGNAIDDWDNQNNHNGEEVKSEIEPQKILGLAETKEEAGHMELEIHAQTVRIPTQYGHLESLRIKFSEEVDVDEVEEKLSDWRPPEKVRGLPSSPDQPIKVLDRQPEPRKDVFEEDGMAVTVGDIRQLDSQTVSLFSLSHNLRRGATWTARQSMELYLREEGEI